MSGARESRAGNAARLASLLHALMRRRRGQSPDRFRSTWYSAPVGLAFGGVDGRIVDVNPAFERIIGRSAEVVRGGTFLDFTHPDDVSISAENRGRLHEPGDRVAYEKRFLRPDGTSVWTQVNLHLAQDRPGSDPYIIGVVSEISQRKAAETAAAEAQRSVAEILDLAPDAVFIASPEMRGLGANPRALEMTGYTLDEIRQLSMPDLVAFDEQFPLPLEKLREGAPVVSERRLRRRDGSEIPVEISGRMLPGGGFLGFVRDISDRQQARALLQRSEARFRRIFESNTAAIAFWMWDGRITDANDAYLAITGYDREDLREGRIRWRDLPATPADAEILTAMVEDIRRSGSSRPHERTYRRRDGNVVRVLTSAATLDNDVYDGVSIIIDIEDRQRALEALRRSEERFRELIERSHDITAVLDTGGRYLYHSPSLEKVLGYSPDELLGSNAFDLMHPSDVGYVRAEFQRAIVDNRETGEVEYRFRAADGSWKWLHSVGVNLIDSPAVGGIVINSRDVTDRRRLREAVERAERTARLGRVAATMAHEFNNVLMSIQPFVEILRKGQTGPSDIERIAAHMTKAVQRGKRVTSEVLRFTQSGDPVLALMDVRQWLEELMEELAPSVSPTVSLQLEAGEDLFIWGDRAQLSQAVVNIVVNARDAMPSGGTITIRATLESSNSGRPLIEISIRDKGAGIPQQIIDSIFEPMFTTKKGGTGLGLPLAQQFVIRHGGDLRVESRMGEGSQFTLILPATSDRPSPEPPSSEQATTLSGARILMIEDELPVAEGVSALLEMDGHQVRVVQLGLRAEAAIEDFVPQVVILDIGLPDIDGLELYQMLRSRFPHLGYIIASGHVMASSDHAPAGARFVQKPYEVHELLDAVAAALPQRPPDGE